MLIDVHERLPDGRPGKLFTTVEREPKFRKSTQTDWVKFGEESYPVLTGVRNFIVVPPEKLASVKQVIAVPLRTRHKRTTA